MSNEPGLSIETASSVLARDMILNHFEKFGHVIQKDRHAGQRTIAAYVDGLAGAMALVIAGRHGSREEVINATIAELRKAVDRDLKHLKAT